MKKIIRVLLTGLFFLAFCTGIYFYLMMEFFNTEFFQVWNATQKMFFLFLKGESYKISNKAIYIIVGSYLFPLTLVVLGGVLLLFKRPKADYGKSRFANMDDLSDLDLNTEKGLWLGVRKRELVLDKNGNPTINPKTKKPYTKEAEPIDIKTIAPLACLVVAPPGTGKTSGVIIPNLLSLPNSCVVLDIKGENEELTSDYRRKYFNNEILIFNPFGIKIRAKEVIDEETGEVKEIREVDTSENTLFFNPFAYECVKDLNFAELNQLALQLANTIFVNKEDDHWLKTSKEFFVFFAMIQVCQKGGTTLFELSQAPHRDYFDELQGEFKESVCYEREEDEEELKRDPKADTFRAYLAQIASGEFIGKLYNNTTREEWEIIMNQARRWSNSSGTDEFANIRSSYSTYMGIFSDPRIKEATGTMNFHYQDLRNKRLSLYIKVAQTDVETLGALLRIMLETIAKNLCVGEEVGKNYERYVYLYLDEFVRFGKMEFILRLPELSRSYGVVPIYVSQSYGQFEITYSKQHLDILLSITHFQLIFRINAYKDAEEVSKTIGNFTREKDSISKKGLFGGKDSTSTSLEGYSLMTAQDIMAQDKDDIIIMVSGNKDKPLKVQINKYFENEELLKRFNLNKELRSERMKKNKLPKEEKEVIKSQSEAILSENFDTIFIDETSSIS